MSVVVLQGDARTIPLKDESVDCVVTSPPFYGLRDYSTGRWEGGDAACSHAPSDTPQQRGVASSTLGGGKATTGHQQEGFKKACPHCGAVRIDKQIGLEADPEAYVAELVAVFREVWRVLRPHGVVFLNLGDSYNAAGRVGHGTRIGYKQGTNRASASGADACRPACEHLKPKDLCMIPARVALALQANGWYLRSVIPWVKRNAMPSSVQDRPGESVEYVFLLAKSERYFYDHVAVQVTSRTNDPRRPYTSMGAKLLDGRKEWKSGQRRDGEDFFTRNRRTSDWFFDSWQGLLSNDDGDPLAFVVNTAGFKNAHFATFPPKLVEPMVKAGTSEAGYCSACGKPWVRVVERESRQQQATWTGSNRRNGRVAGGGHTGRTGTWNASTETLSWEPSCTCGAPARPAVVFDPFGGAGTTALVADRLGRHGIGLDLNSDYCAMARDRIVNDAPLFADLQRPPLLPDLADHENLFL